MNLLFLVMGLPKNLNISSMYWDLAKECSKLGHNVTIISQTIDHPTNIEEFKGIKVLRVKSSPIEGQHNFIKKGIAMAILPWLYKSAYKKYLSNAQFDWVIMPTPPITLTPLVTYIKKKTKAKFYLILRDIHPQSIASLGLLTNKLMYKFLENKSKKAYTIADIIGCMSQGNINFIKALYPELLTSKFTILNNWLTAPPNNINNDADSIRKKYGLENKFVVLFGGNIGIGQRIENILFLADTYKNKDNIVFVVIGKGIEKLRLKHLVESRGLPNVKFVDFMPQQDYLNFVSNADLGLISINENYKVPTCPSKACSYMALGIPILAMINPNNDYAEFINESGAGYAIVGNEKDKVIEAFDKLLKSKELRSKMSSAGKLFFNNNLTTEIVTAELLNQIKNVSR